jgi:hypothetical protein
LISIKSLAKRIHKKFENWEIGKPFFKDPRYHEQLFDEKNFHHFTASSDSQRICFVDGGNLSIINSPSVVVHLTRVGFCIYEGKTKVKQAIVQPQNTFYTIATSFKKNNDLYFQDEIIPVGQTEIDMLPDQKDLVFYSYDQSLKQGERRASLYSIALAARAFAEWSLSRYLIENELSEDDILVRDGSLQTTITGESAYANMAYQAALNKGVKFTGLSKTSTLYTDSGMPLFSAISILGNRNNVRTPWFYYPIVDIKAPDHRARMYAVKLHTQSKHVFRFEVLKDQEENRDSEIIKVLAGNAKDIAFPGYPYGLIEVDRISRVRQEEIDPLTIQIFSEISNLGTWEELEAFLRSTDAHDVLDSI